MLTSPCRYLLICTNVILGTHNIAETGTIVELTWP
jgi:hypothetical protein